MKTILVISPHADDEILGCYGYIASEIAKGSRVHVIYGTVGCYCSNECTEPRFKELAEVANKVGFSWSIIAYNKDAVMDSMLDKEIISYIDNAIKELEPDEVFVNYPSRHQDHKKMYECTMAAMRLKEGFMPSFFALYEYPFITGIEVPNGGCMYFDISDVIEEKVKVFSIYKSQIKSSPSPLNEDGIKALARIRGIECGVKYAEMFYIQKMLVR